MIVPNSNRLTKKAIKDPHNIYKTPEKILRDARLSVDQKEKILESWHEDAEALLRAEGENMSSPESANGAAELLKKINKTREKINKQK